MYYFPEIIKFFSFCCIFFILLKSIKNFPYFHPYTDKTIKKNIKDVLFVNGYDKDSDSYTYRINHQKEQLKAGFLENDECFYLDLEPLLVKNYRVIIFFLCPLTANIEKAISLAKNLNKKVLFDIDDIFFNKIYKEKNSFIKKLSQIEEEEEKEMDDEWYNGIGKTIKLCDGVITTTENLATELKKLVPNVFVNRNVASDDMWKISQNILINLNNTKNNEHLIIGYFSENNTNDQNLKMIKPVLIKILNEFKYVQLLLLDKFELENFLIDCSDQIVKKTYKDWKELSEIISNVDINISPIESNFYNKVKNENKWVKASLLKIPTIASNYGEFKNVIFHNETGLLCSNLNDWYVSLKTLIKNESLRKTIGENAYQVCKFEYNTIYSGRKLANYINSIANKHIGFYIPSIHNTGGFYVIINHACILKEKGWDVDLILPEDAQISLFEYKGHKFNILNLSNIIMSVQYDIIVATFYTTLFSILKYYKTKKRLYLVQGYETDFYPYGDIYRELAEKTYSTPFGVEYITISKWCKNWLLEKYRKNSRYAPNCIDSDNYKPHKRNLNQRKIRILIEGDSNSYFKNIDESFKIIQNLDINRFEVWYLSYKGKPKDWYRFDKFFHEIPHEKVDKIYQKCDILLKSSWLESFSFPPLEMMATGGYCIVVPNEGNKEYLEDGKNCLFYKLGDINSGVDSINRLISDKKLQQRLYENGLLTAKKRDWKNNKKQIISLYDI